MKTLRESKESAEKRAFIEFAYLMNEEDVWLSVENRKSPEPDLLCIHSEYGFVAFELVAITDPLIATIDADAYKGSESCFSTSDPTERIIRKKLTRKYVTDHPIELLVYNDLLTITPDEIIKSKVIDWAGSKSHSFKKIWFKGEHSATCLWVAD